MPTHKSEDYKLSAVKYFLENKDTQENTCRICKCSVRSLLRWTYEDLNNNIKEVIKTIPEGYYKKILNGTYNRQTKYIKKNKIRKYKNYKD